MNLPLIAFVVAMLIWLAFGITEPSTSDRTWRSRGAWLIPWIAVVSIGWAVFGKLIHD